MTNELAEGKSNNSINQLLSVTSEKETARRAVNQLLLVIVGRKDVEATDSFKADTKLRLKKCTELAMEEYSIAQSLLQDCVPDAKRMIINSQKKLDSLNSLIALSNVIEEMP